MGKEIQYRLKLITNKNKKLILGVTVVYDFLATSRNRLRAGPNAKTKDDRADKLIYDIASGFGFSIWTRPQPVA